MCLGTIARVVEVWQDREVPMARVDAGRGHETVCLLYAPEAAVGGSVLIHQGYAVEVLEPEAAVDAIELRAGHDAGGDRHGR
jgi:hydrogenase maturation factor